VGIFAFSFFLFFCSSCSFSFFRVSGFCVGLAGLSLATHDVLSSPCTVMKPHRGSPARDPRVPHKVQNKNNTRKKRKEKKTGKRKSPHRNKNKKTTFFQNKVKCFFSVRQFDAKTKKTYITLHFVTYECREHYNTFKTIGKT